MPSHEGPNPRGPDYDAEREREEAYRQDIGTYYGPYFYP
jgi:hypothetical protein